MRFQFDACGYRYDVTGPLKPTEAMARANDTFVGLPTPGAWIDVPAPKGVDRAYRWSIGNYCD
jgi:hypothetical protein